jgi:hypothetical protein
MCVLLLRGAFLFEGYTEPKHIRTGVMPAQFKVRK